MSQKIATPLQRIICALIAVVGVLFLVFYISGVLLSPLAQDYITKSQFDAVQPGMSYSDVSGIMGVGGELLSTTNIGDDSYKTDMYVWYGKRTGANCNITFQGGKVVSKAQFGLD